MGRTSVEVDRDSLLDLHAIKVELARREDRRVTLGETVARLVAAWRERPADAAKAATNGRRP